MAVDPQFQGRGIGQALIRKIECMGRERSVTRLRMETRMPTV
ncbi:MAG: GNAT family N-acetyltransferase [Lentisphaerae bacterium]|nr:GNAT family N-acetyltransferase [Lentisphaerota bacterium]